jgi:hypothetical protein
VEHQRFAVAVVEVHDLADVQEVVATVVGGPRRAREEPDTAAQAWRGGEVLPLHAHLPVPDHAREVQAEVPLVRGEDVHAERRVDQPLAQPAAPAQRHHDQCRVERDRAEGVDRGAVHVVLVPDGDHGDATREVSETVAKSDGLLAHWHSPCRSTAWASVDAASFP